ncbi:hypothetical protein RI129_010366 [Pyrocoelia pectoralis]|uniref:Uncharacterized protein n=1 Tax=Pyrocoelia pectoralis TaxID=417401 RepID=A0AAN7VDB3_9COLE
MSVCVFFLFFFLCVSNIDGASRTVTNEDIRDAILSIVNVIRSTEDKLERHEFRERTLGDQLKKVLQIIEKRQRLFDPVKGTIGRLDQRLATVETILLQKDERERIQVQRVFDMVEQIHRSLPQLFETLKNDITSSFSSGEEKQQDVPNNVEIEKLQKQIANKIDDTSSTVKNIEGQLSQIREENKNNFSSTHKFMEQYDNKLKEYNKQIDIIPSRCKQVTDLQTDVILKVLVTQDLNIKKLQAEVNGANATIRDLQQKIGNIHGNIESGQKDVKETLKELVKDSRQNYQNYDSKLSAYKDKMDEIPTIYKNGTETQTKELLKVFQTHDANLKQLQNELIKLNANTKTLPEQHVKIIDKLGPMSKLINTGDLLLSQSKATQDALNKIGNANEQLKKLDLLPKLIDNDNLLLKQSKATQDAINKQIGNANEQLKKLEFLPKLIDNDNLLLSQSKAVQDALNRQIGNGNEQLKKLDLLSKLIDNDNLLLKQSKAAQDAINNQIGNANEQLKKLDFLPKLIDNDNLLLSQSKAAQDALSREIGNGNEQLKKLDLLPNLIDNDNLLLKQSKAAQDAIINQIGNTNEQLKNLDLLRKLIDNDNLLLKQSKAAQDAINNQIGDANKIDNTVTNAMKKLMDNDNLLLSQSKAVQDALNKQLENQVKSVSDQLKKIAEEIPKGRDEMIKALNSELPRKIDASEESIRKKMLELQNSWKTTDQQLAELPKKQQADEIMKVLNDELPKKFEDVQQKLAQLDSSCRKETRKHLEESQKRQGDELVKVLKREFELTTKNSARQLMDDLKGYTNESKTQRGLILEAVNVQRGEILDRITKSCSDQTDLLKKDLQMHTQILQRDNLITSDNIKRLLVTLTDSLNQTGLQNEDLKRQRTEDLEAFGNKISLALDKKIVTVLENQKRFNNLSEALMAQIHNLENAHNDDTEEIISNLTIVSHAIGSLAVEVHSSLKNVEELCSTQTTKALKEIENGFDRSLIEKMADYKQILLNNSANILKDLQTHNGEVMRSLIENRNILQRHESELVDYNDKMDSLPWKHKAENDKQTEILLEALKLHANSTVEAHISATNENKARSDETLRETVDRLINAARDSQKERESGLRQYIGDKVNVAEGINTALRVLTTEVGTLRTITSEMFHDQKTNEATLLKDLNGTVGNVMELLQLQPKQNEERATSLVQTIEKQMLFIATTAASNINDRLDRITSSQFEQFTNKMDAFTLNQKDENNRHHNVIIRECANQNSVTMIESRLMDALTKLKELSDAAIGETLKFLQDDVGKLPEMVKRMVDEAISAPTDIIRANDRELKDMLMKMRLENNITEAIQNRSTEMISLKDTIYNQLETLRSTLDKELQKVVDGQATIFQEGTKEITDVLEARLNESISKVNDLPLKMKMEFAQQASIIFQAIKLQSVKTEKLYANVQNISNEVKNLPEKLTSDNNQQTHLILQAMEVGNFELSSISEMMKNVDKYLAAIQSNLRNKTVDLEIENRLKEIGNRQNDINDLKAQLDNVTVILMGIPNDLQNFNREMTEKVNLLPSTCEKQSAAIIKALEAQTKQVKKLEKHIENKTLSTNDALQTMQTNLAKIDENAQKHGDISEGIKKNITIHNELLQKYNAKLDDYHAEQPHNKLVGVTKRRQRSTERYQERERGNFGNYQRSNETAQQQQQTTECNNSASLEEIKNVTAGVRSSLEDLKRKSDNTKLLDSMKLLEELTDSLNTNIALSFGKLMDEMNNLEKLEEIVRQTGDGVVDTKRRVEYGVHQISTEVSNLIKAQTKELSTGLNTRFNNLETSLLDEDEGILANLTTKAAQEVDQVWKQIGMMHQQLTSTNELISGLVSRADRFANGTTTTMDTMRGKIGIITSRVIEVGNNLNTLLGRISLISQEFNIIKKELGNTLNEMKRQTVENRMRPPAPTGSSGPYPVNRI